MATAKKATTKATEVKTVAFFFVNGIIFLCSITIMKEVVIW